jgi:SOS-response transcriptional repressor LexA
VSANRCGNEGPTDRQAEVLRAISEHFLEHGYGISHRGLCARFGWASTNSSNDHIKALERKGFIERDALVARCFRLTPRAERFLRSFPPSSEDGRTTFKHTSNAARQIKADSQAVNNAAGGGG